MEINKNMPVHDSKQERRTESAPGKTPLTTKNKVFTFTVRDKSKIFTQTVRDDINFIQKQTVVYQITVKTQFSSSTTMTGNIIMYMCH